VAAESIRGGPGGQAAGGGDRFGLDSSNKGLTAADRPELLSGSAERPMPIEIKIRKNEPVDRAIRRLKKKLDREGVLRDVRAKRYYEKPCEERRRKEKVAAFNAMLRARYNS
jgi:small subunit ribosomal protein S21